MTEQKEKAPERGQNLMQLYEAAMRERTQNVVHDLSANKEIALEFYKQIETKSFDAIISICEFMKILACNRKF